MECSACGQTYERGRFVWVLIAPQFVPADSPLWQAWNQLQENGMVSYAADPQRNLSVGERQDCHRFAEFCHARGLVLDVGCGPQPWPAYFERGSGRTYVGVDPLADESPSDFMKFAALAEHLPFGPATFDHILFSTTLDHFVDPAVALAEAARVCRPDGEIDVWLGEKDPDSPPHATSPEWYQRLQRPALAEDVFHIRRLTADRFMDALNRSPLTVRDHVAHQIDAYRTNHFFRLVHRR
jgi:SAM-dependent methyltransferase